MKYSNIVLIPQPDCYGRFAHQAFSILAGWSIAHKIGCFFLPRPFTYFSSNFNQYVDFSVSSRSAYVFEGKSFYRRMSGKSPDMYGNTKYNLNQLDNICDFLAELELNHNPSADYILLEMPFDQTAGRFLKRLTEAMKLDLIKIFKPLGLLTSHEYSTDAKSISQTSIAIHIRRGDVTPSRHPSWHIADIYYENAIHALYSLFGDKARIRILCEESDIAWSNVSAINSLRAKGIIVDQTNYNLQMHPRAAIDFSHMLNSDILISGQSGFSMLAAMIKHGNIPLAVMKNESSYFPQSVNCTYRINAESDLVSIESAKRIFGDCKYIRQRMAQ